MILKPTWADLGTGPRLTPRSLKALRGEGFRKYDRGSGGSQALVIQEIPRSRNKKRSSYRFYAYGEESRWTSHLTPPQWYMDLADTPDERQAQYREQCDQYYLDKILPELEEAERGYAYGRVRYVNHRERFLRGAMARIRDGRIPRRTLDRWVLNHLTKQVAKSKPQSRPPP